MTLDEYISKLNDIRDQRGGNVRVVVHDDDMGSWHQPDDPRFITTDEESTLPSLDGIVEAVQIF